MVRHWLDITIIIQTTSQKALIIQKRIGYGTQSNIDCIALKVYNKCLFGPKQ